MFLMVYFADSDDFLLNALLEKVGKADGASDVVHKLGFLLRGHVQAEAHVQKAVHVIQHGLLRQLDVKADGLLHLEHLRFVFPHQPDRVDDLTLNEMFVGVDLFQDNISDNIQGQLRNLCIQFQD